MAEIKILHKRNPNNKIRYDRKFYCGRGSALGNEFNFRAASSFETETAVSVEDACKKMKLRTAKYLSDKDGRFKRSEEFKKTFREILTLYKSGKNIALECYCLNYDDGLGIRSGHRCHTFDYKILIEKIAAEYPEKDFHDILAEWVDDESYAEVFSKA